MDKVKFMATFVVAAGIIIGGYFLSAQNPMGEVAGQKQTTGDKLGLSNPLQTDSADTNGVAANQNYGTSYTPTDAGGNVTKMVAQSMFLKMKQLDQNGTNPFTGLDSQDPQTRALVEDSINNVPTAIFDARIEDKDINISKDNSRNAKIEYLKGIARITKDRLTGKAEFTVNKQELIDNLNSDCFGDGSTKNAELGHAYGVILNDYKNLIVPSDWLTMHKAIMGHFKELSDLYTAFSGCKDDPLKAYVGIEKLNEAYAQTKDIQNMIDAKAAELGLQ